MAMRSSRLKSHGRYSQIPPDDPILDKAPLFRFDYHYAGKDHGKADGLGSPAEDG